MPSILLYLPIIQILKNSNNNGYFKRLRILRVSFQISTHCSMLAWIPLHLWMVCSIFEKQEKVSLYACFFDTCSTLFIQHSVPCLNRDESARERASAHRHRSVGHADETGACVGGPFFYHFYFSFYVCGGTNARWEHYYYSESLAQPPHIPSYS